MVLAKKNRKREEGEAKVGMATPRILWIVGEGVSGAESLRVP